jgi:hypothetical protein
MAAWITALGGTKNLMCWGILLVSSIMLAVDKIPPDLWGTVVLGTAGGYILGNVGATFANGYSAKAEKK